MKPDNLLQDVLQIIDQATDSSPDEDFTGKVTWLLCKRPLKLLEPVYDKPASWIRDLWRRKDGAPRVYHQCNGLDLFDVIEAYDFLVKTRMLTSEESTKRNAAITRLANGTTRRSSGEFVRRPQPCNGP